MNFALILFLLTLATGIVALADRLILVPARRRAADRALAQFDERSGAASVANETAMQRERGALEEKALAEPWWVEYPKSFFPVLLIVFLLRSFLAEPFKIPSSSMRPTLEVGDFILVNKFAYGIRLPIIEKKIIEIGQPQRGDVIVFRYPINPSQDFIKRVIGLPGDQVVYQDKKLTVNGVPLAQMPDGSYGYLEGLTYVTTEKLLERWDGKSYTIAENPAAQPVYPLNVRSFPGKENCVYNERGFACKVPPASYLMMGDNRDNSDDSRYWGFVPDDHIRGKAIFIWFNWDDISSFAFKRIGTGIH